MATVTGLTAERMQEIIDGTIVNAEVVGDNLVLTKFDETEIVAGNVRGATGPTGPPGAATTQAWQTYSPTIELYGGAMTLTPVDHLSNHSRYLTIGKICFVSFSWVYVFGGTMQQSIAMSLPITAATRRNTFTGHAQNHSISTNTGDEVHQVGISALNGITWVAGTFHIAFQGFYEIA